MNIRVATLIFGLLAALWQLETRGKPQLFLSQTQRRPDHTRSGHMCQLYRGQTKHDGADQRLGIKSAVLTSYSFFV